MTDLEVLELEWDDDDHISFGLIKPLIQRLREAEAERDRLSASEWIDGKTLADQAAEIRRLRNAIEVQVDLRACITKLELVQKAAAEQQRLEDVYGTALRDRDMTVDLETV